MLRRFNGKRGREAGPVTLLGQHNCAISECSLGTYFSCIISKKNPRFYFAQQSKCVCPDLTVFFKVSSANEIPQPWAVLGTQRWVLKHGDSFSGSLEVINVQGCVRKETSRSKEVLTQSCLQNRQKEAHALKRFLSFLWNLFSRRRANTALFNHAKRLLILIVGAQRSNKAKSRVFLGYRMKFEWKFAHQSQAVPPLVTLLS